MTVNYIGHYEFEPILTCLIINRTEFVDSVVFQFSCCNGKHSLVVKFKWKWNPSSRRRAICQWCEIMPLTIRQYPKNWINLIGYYWLEYLCMYNIKTFSNPTKSIRPTKRHCSHFSSTFPIQHPLQPCYKLGSSSHLQGEDTRHYA